jgi:hypothetical protein
MTVRTPTRITIEVHPPADSGDGIATPVVRVVPEGPVSARSPMASDPREDVPVPAAFDPGPCHCLDDEDCNADHAND